MSVQIISGREPNGDRMSSEVVFDNGSIQSRLEVGIKHEPVVFGLNSVDVGVKAGNDVTIACQNVITQELLELVERRQAAMTSA